jgi:hypothetical protein
MGIAQGKPQPKFMDFLSAAAEQHHKHCIFTSNAGEE